MEEKILKIQKIKIKGNNISESGAQKITSVLKTCSILERFDFVDENSFSVEAAEEMMNEKYEEMHPEWGLTANLNQSKYIELLKQKEKEINLKLRNFGEKRIQKYWEHKFLEITSGRKQIVQLDSLHFLIFLRSMIFDQFTMRIMIRFWTE